MLPHQHLILGIVLGLAVLLIYPAAGIIGFLIIVLSSVLIDIDHYAYYVYRTGEKSIIKAYNWYRRSIRKTKGLSRKEKRSISFGFHFLHGIETLLLLYILYFYISPIFLYILIGVSCHLFLDLTDEIIECGRLEKLSIIYGFILNKKLKFIDELNLPEPEITQELKIPFFRKH